MKGKGNDIVYPCPYGFNSLCSDMQLVIPDNNTVKIFSFTDKVGKEGGITNIGKEVKVFCKSGEKSSKCNSKSKS